MKVQFNNFYGTTQNNVLYKNRPVFKSGSIERKLIIQNINPLISDKVRELATWFNDFYIGIEKQINSQGYRHFLDVLTIDGQDIELWIDKNPYPTTQIGKMKFNKRVSSKPNIIENITYYPQQQSGGKYWDHIYNGKILYGDERTGIIHEEVNPESSEKTPKICEIFVKYAEAFKEKLEPLKDVYQFVEYPTQLWKR